MEASTTHGPTVIHHPGHKPPEGPKRKPDDSNANKPGYVALPTHHILRRPEGFEIMQRREMAPAKFILFREPSFKSLVIHHNRLMASLIIIEHPIIPDPYSPYTCKIVTIPDVLGYVKAGTTLLISKGKRHHQTTYPDHWINYRFCIKLPR